MRKLGSGYVLHEMLGQGTTGQVWRGAHVSDGTPVAIKVLRPELADDPEIVNRFLREWDLLAELDSPDLVQVQDLVNEPDALAIVMDLVEGVDLRAHLDRHGPRPVSEAVRLVAGVLWALDTVHAAGIVHRDVKPENVMIDTSDPAQPYVRLTDFGIARVVHTASRAGRTGPIGTPLYMAPEVGSGAPPTPAADVYAAGVVLYELLAGSPPFDEAHPADMLRAHREDEPLPIQGVPTPVWDVLVAMLAKSPRHRPASAAEAAEDLIAALEHRRDRDLDTDRDPDFAAAHTQITSTGEFDGWDRQATGLGPVVRPNDRTPVPSTSAHRAGAARPEPAAAGALAGSAAHDTWAGDAHTQVAGMPPVRADWNDGEHTMIADATGEFDGWKGEGTGSRPAVRVPARSSGTASDRNTVISAIPANKQPGPGGGGGRPVPDRRRRTRIAASAGLVVALVAGAGGWALAAAGEGESSLTADSGAEVTVDPDTGRTMMPAGTLSPGISASPSAAIAGASTTRPNSSTLSRPPGGEESPASSAPADASSSPSPTPTDATVPNVVGRSQSAANSTLADAGFTNVTANEVCQQGEAAGEVLSQSPSAGAVTAKSTRVTLTVQDDCVEVPSGLVGLSITAAQNRLSAVGLSGLQGGGGCNYGTENTVASTNPGAGTIVKSGTGVWLEPTCRPSPTPAPAPTPTPTGGGSGS